MDGHWMHSWASVPQPVDPTPAAGTLRQTIRASVGGSRLRLAVSNAFGGGPLDLTAMTVARPVGGQAGVSALQPGTVRPVSFAGSPSVRVAAGAEAVSDPVEFTVAPGENLAVTIGVAGGALSTGHPGSRTTSYLAPGQHADAADLAGAVAVDHWYLLSGLEVWSGGRTAASVILGDSLTDGRGSTTNGNDRWPDRLLDRLRADPDTAGIAILNQAAGGNRVLRDGIGPSALSRVDRDLPRLRGVAWWIVFAGANDIGTAAATGPAQREVTGELVDAYDRIVRAGHARGIRVYGATLIPFGGHDGYDDPAGVRAASRQAVNDWIRGSGRFDATVDFDRAVRDPGRAGRLPAAFDGGDHLHLNPAGYQALADAVPVGLFQP